MESFFFKKIVKKNLLKIKEFLGKNNYKKKKKQKNKKKKKRIYLKKKKKKIKNSSFKENEVKQYENLLKLDFKKLLEELKKIINSFQPHSERKVPQKIDRFDVSLSCEASRRCGSTKDLVVCEDNRRKEYYVG